MKYESERDVELRLKGSIVKHNGRPVYVEAVHDVNLVTVLDILEEERTRVTVDSLDLQPTSCPLGYVIDEDGTVYWASRKPARKYKQGLSQDALSSVAVGRKEMVRGLRFASKGVARTMLGEFPDIGKAFKAVRSGNKRLVPFAREWAVGEEEGDVCLLYRGKVVGFATDTTAKLMPEYFYLKESLEGALV